MPEYLIRPAALEEAPVITSLLRAAFAEYKGKLDPPSGAHSESVETVRGLLQSESTYVAVLDSEIVGAVFYRAHPDHADEVYLHRLAVLPHVRRFGIGRALVEAVEQSARELGADWVSLNVRIALPANRNYYYHLGYNVSGFAAHPGYSAPTYAMMRKRVGTPIPRAIVVEEWSPFWAEEYERAASNIQSVLGDSLLEIHHVGSTAVKGLAAKPIIDLAGVTTSLEAVDRCDPRMMLNGWQPRGENGIPGRRYFVKRANGIHTHHLHIYESGHPAIERYLALVAYLNANPSEAARYATAKRAAAEHNPKDSLAYMDEKSPLVQELIASAMEWYPRFLAAR